MKVYSLMILSLLFAVQMFAQKDIRSTNKGNEYYMDSNFIESEIKYREAMELNNRQFEAQYNLGNSLFRQEKYKEAAEQYKNALALADGKPQQAQTYHNMGNALLKGEQIEESIEAYKNSLKLNPKDDETRYNLAFAKHLLKKQQEQQQQQDQKKEEKEDQEQKEQEKHQEQDKQDQQQEQQQQQQQQQQQMSKETAQQILEALEQDEKDVQEKVQAQKKQGKRSRTEKDW